jgi:Immunity protein 50
MTNEAILQDIPGGKALLDWFGRVPRFHDANLLEIALNSKGLSVMRVHTWRMTNKVDAHGYIELDKHVVVTIILEEVTDVTLTEFNLPGIIFDLEVTKADEGIQLSWGGSYGVSGTLRAKKIRFDLQPGKP